MDIHKVIQFLVKHWIRILLLILIIIIPIPIIHLLYWLGEKLGEYAFETVFTSSEILSYFSGVWGALLGSIATFIALYFTISYEKNERKIDRRLSNLQYFDFSLTDPKENKALFKQIIHLKHEEMIEFRGEVEDFSFKYDIIFNLKIKNIGIGYALNVCIVKEEYDGEDTGNKDEIGIILANNEAYIEYDVLVNGKGEIRANNEFSGWKDLVITLVYENVLHECYYQIITIRCTWSSSSQAGKIIKCSYNAGIINVTEPKPYEKKKTVVNFV